MSLRIGILGGTFDPIHLGHLIVAQEVHDRLSLDRMILVPAGLPPHRMDEPLTPGRLRVEMVQAAVEGDPRFEVSEIEVARPGPSYTVDTLRALRKAMPDARFYVVLGTDQLRVFHQWHQPEAILALATLVSVDRAGSPADGDIEVPHRPVQVPRIDISASDVRDRIGAGRPVRFLIPDRVLRIIERESLYHQG